MGGASSDSGSTSRLGRRFGVLRQRDLRLVFGSTLVSGLGDGAVGVALAFAVLDLTHSATDLGIVMAARTVTMVCVALIGGVVADRASRRAVMVTADLVRFCSQLAVGALLLSGQATVFEIVVSQVLVSAGNAFFNPASAGLLQAISGEYGQEANALKTIAISGSAILGPALGGVLVAAAGSSYALIIDGASYLLSALLLLRVSHGARSPLAARTQPAPFLADLRGGLHEVAGRRWVWTTIVNMATANLLMASFPVLAPLICKDDYGGVGAYAGLGVSFALGMLLGGTSLLRFRPRFPLRTGFIAFLPALLPGIALGLQLPLGLVLVAQFLSGAGMTVMGALWWTALQEHIPPAAISRVSSYDWAGTLAVMPIGYALVGPIAESVGAGPTLVWCYVGALLVTLSALLVPDIRMLPARPASKAEPI